MTTAADLIDAFHRFYSTHGQMPRAVSLSPEFRDRIAPDPEITRETEEYKNEFHGVPFIVNPNLESDWLLIKPENL